MKMSVWKKIRVSLLLLFSAFYIGCLAAELAGVKAITPGVDSLARAIGFMLFAFLSGGFTGTGK